MQQFAKFQEPTRRPEIAVPPGSCDCQVHVFGDPARYKIYGSATYVPFADADIDAALRMHGALGVERGVIVQATVHRTDHAILYDALAKAGPNYRGIALIDNTVSDQEIERLHSAGVRGARFNFWKALNIVPSPEEFLRSIERIKPYGWHIKVHASGDEWIELGQLLSKVSVPMVIDHLGHPHIEDGLDQASVRFLMDLVRRENCWMLLSNADRVSAQESGWEDTIPLVRRFAELAPDRIIWCTDWPHVKYEKRMPNDAEILDFLARAIPDRSLQRKILVDNPARLFGF